MKRDPSILLWVTKDLLERWNRGESEAGEVAVDALLEMGRPEAARDLSWALQRPYAQGRDSRRPLLRRLLMEIDGGTFVERGQWPSRAKTLGERTPPRPTSSRQLASYQRKYETPRDYLVLRTPLVMHKGLLKRLKSPAFVLLERSPETGRWSSWGTYAPDEFRSEQDAYTTLRSDIRHHGLPLETRMRIASRLRRES